MAVLTYALVPFNSGFYEDFINYDPQGAQTHEWWRTKRIFQYTSGMLCGQLLALWTGMSLGRRYRHCKALPAAVALGSLLAATTFAVAFPVARSLDSHYTHIPELDAVLLRVIVVELLAYPLFAAAGVGVAVLRGPRRLQSRVSRWVGPPLLVLGWAVVTLAGLLQDDGVFAVFRPLLWVLPPFAAAAALSGGGLSRDVWSPPFPVVGDWGLEASIALLVGSGTSAVLLNILGHRARRPGSDGNPVITDTPDPAAGA